MFFQKHKRSELNSSSKADIAQRRALPYTYRTPILNHPKQTQGRKPDPNPD